MSDYEIHYSLETDTIFYNTIRNNKEKLGITHFHNNLNSNFSNSR